MTYKRKKHWMLLVVFTFIFSQTAITAHAGTDSGYHSGDIAVINAMIDNNQLSARKNDPASWHFARWTPAGGSNLRISELDLTGKNLTGHLDVSGLSSLKRLDCGHNQIQTLNVSGTALTHLNCSVNPLTSLTGLSGLSGLERLYCAVSQLQHLDLSGLTALTDLGCHNNQLQALDLSGLSSLVTLNCAGNQLDTLDLTSQTALTSLDCSANQLTRLTGLSRLSALEDLNCSNNRLQTLDLAGLTGLRHLDCDSNQLTALDLTGLTSLTNLYCQKNLLTALDTTDLRDLKDLACGDNLLTSFKANGQELNLSAGTGGMAIITFVSLENNQAGLTTIPDSGFSFRSWKGLPAGSSNASSTIIPMADSLYLTAVFAPF